MKKILPLFVLLALVGCFRDMSGAPISRVVIFEGPIDVGGQIEPGLYQNGIEMYYDEIDIIVNGGPLINGSTSFYSSDNGQYWLTLDLTMLIPGDIFTININGETHEFEVI